MTALAANKARDVLGDDGTPDTIGAAANAVWFHGSLISRNAAGYGIASTDTASTAVVGTAIGDGNNTGGANGDVEIPIRWGQVEGFTAPNLGITDVGLDAVVVDDATVAGATEGTNDIRVGRIRAYRNGKAYVQVAVTGSAAAT